RELSRGISNPDVPPLRLLHCRAGPVRMTSSQQTNSNHSGERDTRWDGRPERSQRHARSPDPVFERLRIAPTGTTHGLSDAAAFDASPVMPSSVMKNVLN